MVAVHTVSHSPKASCRLRPRKRAPTVTPSVSPVHRLQLRLALCRARQVDTGDICPGRANIVATDHRQHRQLFAGAHLPKPHGHLDIGKPEIAMRDLVGHVQVSIRTTQVVFRRGQFTNQRSNG